MSRCDESCRNPGRGSLRDDADWQGTDSMPWSELVVGYARPNAKLLSKGEEATLSRELRNARRDMVGALAKVPGLIPPVLDAWQETKTHHRASSDVIHNPLAGSPITGVRPDPTRCDPGAQSSATTNADQRIDKLRQRYELWQRRGTAYTPYENAALRAELERLFIALTPAYIMLRELERRLSALLTDRTNTDGQLLRIAGCDRASLQCSHNDATIADARYRTVRDALVEANVGLVFSVAHKFRDLGIPFDDLVQEGQIGLIRAVDKFDERLGHRFSTYALHWVRQAVTRALADKRRTVRLPGHVNESVLRFAKLIERLRAELMRSPTVEELSQASALPEAKVHQLLSTGQVTLSLDAEINREGAATFGQLLRDSARVEPSELIAWQQLQRTLEQLLDALPREESLVLRLHHGIGVAEAFTFEQIGERMGRSREWARLLERQALARIRAVADRRLAYYLHASISYHHEPEPMQ